jgi:endoglucanase
MKSCLMVITNILLVILSCISSGGCSSVSGPEPKKGLTAKPSPSKSEASPDIRLDSLGYLPAANKQATIISQCSDFTVKAGGNRKAVYYGKTSGPFYQQDVNQTVWIAYFSKVNKPGKYYLDISGVGRSYDFEIGDKVYNFAFYTAMRAFYLWRCGTAVEGEFNGNRFAHTVCHTDDAWQDYIGEPNSRRDGTGGWHDAGDYNKYVVNAGVTVGVLFLAWDHFQDNLKNLSLDIPDTAPGYPDFLKEIKWEIDWLLKMQYPDGSGKVSHKLSALNFCGFIMPEDEKNKRYYTGWSSAATADFVAMMAMAARYFKPYDPNYAQKCLDAAIVSYEFLRNNPENKMSERGPFRTGGYPTMDYDDRLWAAAEMWQTTGEVQYRRDFEWRAGSQDDKISYYWDWGDVKNLGMFTYLLSNREGKRDSIVDDIRRDLLTTADSLVVRAKKDVYGRCLGGEYRWGCNGTVARETLTLMVANKVSPNPDYVNTALDVIGHLFGRNYYGRSYVTGLGHLPPMNPHDRRSGADKIREPWPGYIVGGGHSARDWRDIQQSASTNEICINWQAPLVYALAGFTSAQSR